MGEMAYLCRLDSARKAGAGLKRPNAAYPRESLARALDDLAMRGRIRKNVKYRA